MNDLFKYPRTIHIEGSRLQEGDEDLDSAPFDLVAGQFVVIEEKLDGANSGISFSPDGTWIASSGNDSTIKVWDSITGADIFTLTGHTGPTFGVAFSADGEALATSSVDRTIKVWQLPRPGEPVAEPLTLYGNTGAVYHVAFSPDGARLASAGRDQIVHVYDLNIQDLAAIAQARLTRTLTPEECQKYLHMAQCPTLKANE